MKRYSISTAVKTAFSVGALSLALAGCGGSDGKDGEDGKPGEIAIDINSATAVQTQIEKASFDETSKTLTFEFSLTNPNGVAVTGLETLTDPLRIAFGRMGTRSEAFTPFSLEDGTEVTARGDGDEEIWLSYRNASKNGVPMTGSNNWRPTRDCQEGVTCLAYLGQGRYQVTAPEIIDTNGLDYGYDANRINGIYLITYGVGQNKLKNVEAYYWDPLTEQSVASPKKVLEMETCTNCHVGQDHIRHGNYGNTADGCGFCHTDYTQYSGSGVDGEGNTVEFNFDGSIKGLAHAIHTGITEGDRRELAKFNTVIANASKNPAFAYKFDGAALDSEGQPKAELNFPASTANCQSCHISYTTTEETLPEGLTPHAMAWFADKDAVACQTCHGDYHYGNRTELVGEETQLVGCVACHSSHDGNTRGGAFRHFAGHEQESSEAASQAGTLIDASYSQINWDEASNTLSFTMHLTKGEEIVSGDYTTGMRLYVNAVDATKPDAFLAGRTSGSVMANIDGSYSVTVNAANPGYGLPSLADAIKGGANIAITPSFKTCFANKSSDLLALVDGVCPLDSRGRENPLSANAATTAFLTLSGEQAPERASAVDYENCASCHNNDMVARKGDTHYRNADVHTCAQCHEAGDYNSLIVRVHGTFGKAHGREDVQSLVSSANCSACHSDMNFGLENARSTPMRWNKGDASFSSPQAGVCASCHVSSSYEIGGGKEAAKSHIESMGGVVAGSYEEAMLNSESCLTCHSAEKVAELHKQD
ncbi:multiheme c-type cytochrome [Shewanella marisflavi]